ncbi:MAG: ABC transporter ATP-binding protein [Roseofilum sp. SBFL]|uniref:ABC transporter ATP-binding protein n=1 Tax=unclassified Roseofilum TaxID=2620099 RepID=UPI001B1CAFCE|nr:MULTISPECIES: ABC transporter ATP-binding protein [unclassified Roseofilum]MBP0012268.1 ABC transporter ATP-binding protein [Roseofilum sp. SID3]MBP0022894.1 ABC transporter ATP-binding protein [Roseofilum sp. SID2]MBP0037182.1 ABC transporter ATP-binding protein [Roseofilum sp. SID1]MBP0041648.1 ABC transporter ATP-binding protein [Roseofilum sp. SBFL]
METKKPIATLEKVSKRFDNQNLAIADLNLNLYPSEILSLVGPSGCGKSTLLRLISGLTSLSSGTLYWQKPPQNNQLAFVFQDAALMPWATVWQNVFLPLKLGGVPQKKAQEKIQEALELVQLNQVSQSYPRQLSGGMKMRVSIARALVNNPQVLLMDEPFGALDDITRTQLNDELLNLWSQKRWTIVFVTHNIYEAVYLSHRVVVMGTAPGRIIAEIPIHEPYPRGSSFRGAIAYTEYYQQVATALSEAITPH